MWSERTSPMFLVVIVASLVAHVASLAALPAGERVIAAAPRVSTVAIETFTPPPPPSPPPPPEVVKAEPVAERVAARVPTPRAQRPVTRTPAAPPPEIAKAEPAPEPSAPVDFSGVTLSNDRGGWSSPVGNGEPLTGPIAVGPPAPRRGPVRSAPGGQRGPRVVAVGDLSRPMKAPDLDTSLAANYPRDARRAGLTGKAVVRARILVDGTVGTIRIVSETAPGFGAACRRTLAGSRWQPPRDAHDEPVMTDVSYTCTFAVTR